MCCSITSIEDAAGSAGQDETGIRRNKGELNSKGSKPSRLEIFEPERIFVIEGHLHCRWCMLSTCNIVHLILLFRVGKSKAVRTKTQTVCELFFLQSSYQFKEVIDKKIMMYILVKQE